MEVQERLPIQKVYLIYCWNPIPRHPHNPASLDKTLMIAIPAAHSQTIGSNRESIVQLLKVTQTSKPRTGFPPSVDLRETPNGGKYPD